MKPEPSARRLWRRYEKAIELDPSFTGLEARLYKAGILADLGRHNESIDAFDKIIETCLPIPPYMLP